MFDLTLPAYFGVQLRGAMQSAALYFYDPTSYAYKSIGHTYNLISLTYN
ncbi:hypothetical protein DYBT9623_02012 [Dyadobacter sp. CECT 9623]|uniref:Uncharacterized protein n=1 Tax=Dyadobacter linearis TaxID=2823330 RepID=A0ABM8UPC0_9BACT|nr:hypothetical protein DYBT9623_02012 [Dyadobacter sp. CECT 9623]